MAEEEKEVEEPQKRKGLTEWMYVGLLIVLVVAAITFYQSGNTSFFLISFAAVIGALIAVFSPQSSDPQKIITIFIFAIGVFAFLFLIPANLKAEVQSGVSSIAGTFQKENPLTCINNPSQCAQQYSFDSAYVRTPQKIYMDAKPQTNYIKQNQPVEINVDLTAMNQVFDSLNVQARCFLDNKEISAEPSSIVLKKMSTEQSAVFTCKGDYQLANQLIIKLSAEYKAETVLPIEIGKGLNAGKLISSMQYDSPYKLSVSLGYNQPLTEAKKYIMPITLEKQQEFSIQELKSLKVSSTKKEGMAISCEDVPSLEITSLSRDSLKKFLINPDKDIYLFRCNLIVDEVPEYAQNAYIESEAIYSAESEYKTTLTTTSSV
jgi:hypothetical protein